MHFNKLFGSFATIVSIVAIPGVYNWYCSNFCYVDSIGNTSDSRFAATVDGIMYFRPPNCAHHNTLIGINIITFYC